MSQEKKHYLRFQVGRQWYGLDVNCIIEVLHFMALTELPGTPPDVLGLLTLRDEVMPVVDLRQRFGIKDAVANLDTPIIVIRTPEGPLGLAVDEAEDVEPVLPGQISVAERTTSPYVMSVARLDDRLLLLLNAALLRAEVDLPGVEVEVELSDAETDLPDTEAEVVLEVGETMEHNAAD